MKNVVFIVNIKGNYPPDFFEYCFNTWNFWTKRNGVLLFVLESPFNDAGNLPPHLYKYFAFKILKENKIKFNQVAIVDADTMVKWNCPNFFNISKNSFRTILDDELPKWAIASLEAYQFLFPRTTVNWWEYFNSGVMIMARSHKNILSEFIGFVLKKEEEILNIHRKFDLRAGFDQTLFNFFIKEKKIKIHYLPKIYNFYHLSKKKMLDNKEFINYSCIWHFNGLEHSERKMHMQKTWELISKNYH